MQGYFEWQGAEVKTSLKGGLKYSPEYWDEGWLKGVSFELKH